MPLSKLEEVEVPNHPLGAVRTGLAGVARRSGLVQAGGLGWEVVRPFLLFYEPTEILHRHSIPKKARREQAPHNRRRRQTPG